MESRQRYFQISRLFLVYFVGQLLWSANVQSLPVHISFTNSPEFVPDEVNLTLTFGNLSIDLELRRCPHVTFDIPLYTANVDETGEFVYTQETVDSIHNVGMYQDKSLDAVFQISNGATNQSLGSNLIFKGQFRYRDIKYFVTFERRQRRDLTSSEGDYSLQVMPDQEHQVYDYITVPEGHQFASLGPPISDSPGLKNGRRRRRDVTTPNYYIDIAAVVDFKAYSRFLSNAQNNRTLAWTELVQYYAFIISGVDLLYQGINSNDFNIHIVLIYIIAAGNAGSSAYTEQFHVNDTVDSDKSLNAFKNYLAAGNIGNYDHAMLFTGYDLTTDDAGKISSDIVGKAYTGTLCSSDGYSSSIIEDRGGYQCTDTAAHELGHSFSALHDGDTNSCKYSDRYIMASSNSAFTNATRLNPWRFSNCSIQYIKNYTDELMQSSSGATCLTDRMNVTSGLPDVSRSLPGLNVSINDQCRMIYGNQSAACLNLVLDPTSICTKISCESAGKCANVDGALSGTSCGSRKLCLNGDCVSDPRAPVMDESCLFGDDLSYVINNMTCSKMALTQTWLCYESDVRPNCCASCKSIYRPYQDCEYGDHVTWCTTDLCSDNLINCCATCNYSVPITSSSTASASSPSTSPPAPTASSSSPPPISTTTSSSSAASDQLNLPAPSTTVLSWLLLLFIVTLVTSI